MQVDWLRLHPMQRKNLLDSETKPHDQFTIPRITLSEINVLFPKQNCKTFRIVWTLDEESTKRKQEYTCRQMQHPCAMDLILRWKKTPTFLAGFTIPVAETRCGADWKTLNLEVFSWGSGKVSPGWAASFYLVTSPTFYLACLARNAEH